MGTRKTYWEDPFASELSVPTAELASFEGRPAVVLPETLFYPEGGGQLGDVGVLRAGALELRVIDTQIDDAGTIFHVLDAPPAAPLTGAVTAAIDVARRRDHMAHHTAQHMLSRALLDVARAPTVSARLGSTSSTIDVDTTAIADALLFDAEDLVNGVVRSDVAVRAFFPTDDELATLDLRRAPKVASGVRIVEIEGFDLTPCGGTHCTRTGQIGYVRVAGVEKYKGMLRVTFHAAKRATDDARAKDRTLATLAATFSCGPLDVPSAVDKMRADLEHRKAELVRARGELALLLGAELLARHPPDPSGTTMVTALREGDDVGFLRTLAGRLAKRPDVVAICGSVESEPSSDGMLVVAQRGAAARFDCGGWLRAKAQASGGRGGGREERAEGRLPKGTALP